LHADAIWQSWTIYQTSFCLRFLWKLIETVGYGMVKNSSPMLLEMSVSGSGGSAVHVGIGGRATGANIGFLERRFDNLRRPEKELGGL